MSCNSSVAASQSDSEKGSPARKASAAGREEEEDEDEAKAVRPGRAKAGAIADPEDNDVLLGRGKFVNYHPGNVQFREMVLKHKVSYVTCPKSQKPEFAKEIVVELQSRGARFLKQDGIYWYEIDFKQALLKTRQALREGAPEISEQLVHGRKHVKKPERVIKELLKQRSKDAYEHKHRGSQESPQEDNGPSALMADLPLPHSFQVHHSTMPGSEMAMASARHQLLQQQEQSMAAASQHVSFLALQQHHQQQQQPLHSSAMWGSYPNLMAQQQPIFQFLPSEVATLQMLSSRMGAPPLRPPSMMAPSFSPYGTLPHSAMGNRSLDNSFNKNGGSPSNSSRGG